MKSSKPCSYNSIVTGHWYPC